MHSIRWLLFTLLFLTIGSLSQLRATHIVGGDFTYTCLGNNEYAIEMVVYRDCFFGEPYFDNPAVIGVFDGNNELVTDIGFNGQIQVFPMGDDTITNQLDDPCFLIPPNVCVHKTTYRDTVSLPFTPGGYTLAYQRCCRNQTIVNIVTPLQSGATFLVNISEQALLECNSSAKYKNVPPGYICVNQPIDFDHSALDDDGDSLVYRLCTPLLGGSQADPAPRPPSNPPYNEIVWIDPPYSVDDMLGGVPLEIDPVTGQLSGIPNTVGQFVVGVCVDEFRDGELISTTRRDFQYNIGECGETTSAFFSPDFICEGEVLELINESPDTDSFQWIIQGPGFNDSLFFAEDLFLEDLPPGDFSVSLVASNEFGCADTLTKEVTVNTQFNTADFTATFGDCDASIPIILQDESIINDTIAVDREWELFIGDSLLFTEPPFFATSADSILLVLTLNGSNPCVSSDSVWIQPPFPEVVLPDTLVQCINDSIEVNPGLIGADIDLLWRPRELFGTSFRETNPRIQLDSSQFIFYTAFEDSLCPFTGRIWIDVIELDSLNADFSLPDFVCLGDSAQITYEGDSSITRQWRLSTPGFQDSVIVNQDTFQLDFVDTGSYSVSLIVEDENGCVDTISKAISIDLPWVIADFRAIEGRCSDTIGIFVIEESVSQDTADYIREWSFFDPSDSLVSTTRPFFISEPGEYTIVLKVTDSRGCMDSTSVKISSSVIGLGCCPDFDVTPVEACNLTRLNICGETNLDSCFVDYLYAEYTFSYDDSVAVIERVPVDSQGRFCFEADESILDREECVTGWVDLFFIVDSSGTDTITFGSEILNLSGECLNEKCCPEDTLRINIAKNLCLTGSNYEGAHFAIEGSILLNALPEDLEYCDTRPVFDHGIEIDYEYFSVFGGVVKFKGMLYIPNPDVLQRDPATGKYIIPGTMIFCDENGNECEISIFIRLSRSQLDMCVGMPGLMCMHFEVNTYQYQPPIPPQQFNGRVYLPLSVRVPFGTRYNGEAECEVQRYDYEICGIPRQPSVGSPCKIIASGHKNRKGNEIAGLFFEFLSIPLQEWNKYSGIQVRFWNNCGDTCELEPVAVVPLAGGRSAVVEAQSDDQPLIYPVPFSDHFVIRYPTSWEGVPFMVYGTNGKQVQEGNLLIGGNEMRVNTSSWSAGTYIFHARGSADREAKIILIKQ